MVLFPEIGNHSCHLLADSASPRNKHHREMGTKGFAAVRRPRDPVLRQIQPILPTEEILWPEISSAFMSAIPFVAFMKGCF